MGQIEIFENRPPVLGINGLGRIGKLTLWHHVGRKYFKEFVTPLALLLLKNGDVSSKKSSNDGTKGSSYQKSV